MRCILVLVMCGLWACAPLPSQEVSKATSNFSGVSAVAPAAARFVPAKGAAPERGNTAMAADFLDLAFRMESGRSLPVLTRFEGPITVAMTGNVPPTAPDDLARLITRFRAEAGLDIRAVARGPASITIHFHPRAEMQRLVPSAACFVVPRAATLAEYRVNRNSAYVDWATLTRREAVAIFVPSDTSPQEVRDCLHEEVAQALGPLNDLYRLADSVFNDDNFHTVLTGFDMLMLRLHYAPELANGMTEAQVAARLPGLLARMNPAGRRGGSPSGSGAPRAWNDAVSAAFGNRSAGPARRAGAEKMLAIAKAQGWQDSRLGFAWFAYGRATAATDPQTAGRAFAEAGRIYRKLPGALVHAAHVDMQMAALALAADQPEQAITLVDRAVPVVTRAQNASALATLLLMKAEALESLGLRAEAGAVRLDSQGWARYGFGAGAQVRARISEIAALAARGRRS